MAQMNFQYPNMGASFAQGAQTGMALGSMWKKEDNSGAIPVPEVPQRQQVDINQATKQEQLDLAQYKEGEKRYKGVGEFGEFNIRTAMADEVQTPLTKEAIKVGIKPKELEDALKNITSNSPMANSSLEFLKTKFGGDKSSGWQAVLAKQTEIKNMQKQMDNEWGIKTMTALNSLKHVHDKPKDMMGKAGQFDPSVVKAIQNEESAVSGLIGLGGEFATYAKKYLDDVYNKTRDSNPADKSIVYRGYNDKTKKWESWRGYSPQVWKRDNSDIDYESIEIASKQGEGIDIKEKIRGAKDNPNPFKDEALKGNKELTKALVKQFLAKAKERNPTATPEELAKIATDYAKKENYDTAKSPTK
jgi:hypothetical protein